MSSQVPRVSASVYRRRRLVVLVAMVAVVGLTVAVVRSGTWVGLLGGSSSKAHLAAVPSVRATAAPIPRVLPASPTPSPAKSRSLPRPGGALAGMQPSAQVAFSAAFRAARRAGLPVVVTSAHRSAAHQQRLFARAIGKYGSPQAARRWVLPPERSEHVTGRAVDVGPRSTARWLANSGGGYGICRRYANEPWHFEYRATWSAQGCPSLLPHAGALPAPARSASPHQL